MQQELQDLLLILLLGTAAGGGARRSRRLHARAPRAGAGRAHDGAGALDHRRPSERSAAGRATRRRDGAAGDRVQRNAGPARGVVRADAPVHGGCLARAAHAADRHPQRRRSRPARAPRRRRSIAVDHRQHARGSRSAREPGRSAADAVSRRDRAESKAGARRRSICAALAEEVAAHLSVLAEEKKQAISVECPGTPARPRRSALACARRSINLVDNAIKFSPAGGRIVIRVGGDGRAAWSLDVVDSGPGIEADVTRRRSSIASSAPPPRRAARPAPDSACRSPRARSRRTPAGSRSRARAPTAPRSASRCRFAMPAVAARRPDHRCRLPPAAHPRVAPAAASLVQRTNGVRCRLRLALAGLSWFVSSLHLQVHRRSALARTPFRTSLRDGNMATSGSHARR